jgi:hypothetical protein
MALADTVGLKVDTKLTYCPGDARSPYVHAVLAAALLEMSY